MLYANIYGNCMSKCARARVIETDHFNCQMVLWVNLFIYILFALHLRTFYFIWMIINECLVKSFICLQISGYLPHLKWCPDFTKLNVLFCKYFLDLKFSLATIFWILLFDSLKTSYKLRNSLLIAENVIILFKMLKNPIELKQYVYLE